MLELLKARKEEIVAEKTAIELKSDDEAIAELVEAYRAEIAEKFAAEKAAKLVDYDLELKALDNLIAREEAKAIVEEPITEVIEG